MVNFVCGGCGVTLKKKAIGHHITSCSNSSISCMDCQTVFKDKEYEKHNTCVSEAEKYGPKKKNNEENAGKVQEVSEEKAKDKKDGGDNKGTRAYNKTFKNVMGNSLKVTDEVLLQKIWKLMQEHGATKGKKSKNKKRKVSEVGDASDSPSPKKKANTVESPVNGNKTQPPAKKAKPQKKKIAGK